MTPIQQVQAVAAAINGGNLYRPYIVKEITDDKGKTLQSFEPEMKRQVISEETSKQVREALNQLLRMVQVVMRLQMVCVLAEKQELHKKLSMVVIKTVIISFRLSDLHQQMIPNYSSISRLIVRKTPVQFGGVIAAPIVGRIIEEIAPLAGITSREGQIEKEYRWGDPINTSGS